MLQYTIQSKKVYISVLKGVLWDMGQVHCRSYEMFYWETLNARNALGLWLEASELFSTAKSVGALKCYFDEMIMIRCIGSCQRQSSIQLMANIA